VHRLQKCSRYASISEREHFEALSNFVSISLKRKYIFLSAGIVNFRVGVNPLTFAPILCETEAVAGAELVAEKGIWERAVWEKRQRAYMPQAGCRTPYRILGLDVSRCE
jgi:hypothetical protein